VTLIDHFVELRTRLFIALGAWVVGACAAFYFRFALLDWLQAPLPDDITLVATGILEPFSVTMKITAFFGLALASPIIIGQIWGFIAPGLYREERRWAIPFVLLTVLAFIGGIVFAYYAILPLALPIIVGFLAGQIELLPRIGDYISKVLLYMAVFGIIFEMPIVSFLLARLGIIQAAMLTKVRRYSIVVACILAALITPTADPINFALVAVPLVILYEVSIIVVRISQRRQDLARDDSSLTGTN
jgi:sec-independent protein translocase protein TatC